LDHDGCGAAAPAGGRARRASVGARRRRLIVIGPRGEILTGL
jgi:hypothetical protein